MKTFSISDARSHLLEIAEEIEKNPSVVVGVKKRGKPMFTMLSTCVYEGIVEALEILSDEKAMSGIRKSIQEMRHGKGIPWEKARKDFDLDHPE